MDKELDSWAHETVRGLRNVRAEMKALKAVEDDLKCQLLGYLDGAEVGTVDGEPVVKVESIFRDQFDLKRARESPIYADMLAACSTSLAYNQVRLV